MDNPQIRKAPVPQPINLQLTLAEAASIHVILDTVLTAFAAHLNKDEPSGRSTKAEVAKRVVRILEEKLKKAGCVLDDVGWRA